ncbi:hypothetical protein [Nocardia wallacei]|uniref:hypothetical protein n=1 Tax=Nocardia wallacei TaxID=480035 RepID=UPI0024547B17|nr:hypothetical protein [Nocardia wallacei]
MTRPQICLTLEQQWRRYNTVYHLEAQVDPGSIYTIARNVHVVGMDGGLGELVRAELADRGIEAPIMGTTGANHWMFLVRPGLSLEAHIDLRARLVRAGGPVYVSAPGDYISYPTPGNPARYWVAPPVPDVELPPMALILGVAEAVCTTVNPRLLSHNVIAELET